MPCGAAAVKGFLQKWNFFSVIGWKLKFFSCIKSPRMLYEGNVKSLKALMLESVFLFNVKGKAVGDRVYQQSDKDCSLYGFHAMGGHIPEWKCLSVHVPPAFPKLYSPVAPKSFLVVYIIEVQLWWRKLDMTWFGCESVHRQTDRQTHTHTHRKTAPILWPRALTREVIILVLSLL